MSCRTERPAEVCVRRTADILGDLSVRGPISWNERNGQTAPHEASEARNDGRRQTARRKAKCCKAERCEANPPLGRQPADREGLRRRPRAGLHRGHAGLETRRRAPPRRAHRAHRSRRAQSGQIQLAALRDRGPGRQTWFLGIHVFTKYVKVAFFRGASLRPVPPGASKQKDVRYLDIHEDDKLDEAQFAAWVKQASQLPGERM